MHLWKPAQQPHTKQPHWIPEPAQKQISLIFYCVFNYETIKPLGFHNFHKITTMSSQKSCETPSYRSTDHSHHTWILVNIIMRIKPIEYWHFKISVGFIWQPAYKSTAECAKWMIFYILHSHFIPKTFVIQISHRHLLPNDHLTEVFNSGNGLAPCRRQITAWTTDYPVRCPKMRH